MTRKEITVRALERKILRAIERGEFTPDYGYLSSVAFPFGKKVEIGPCGCAIAAAASVNGMKAPPSDIASDDLENILAYLKREVGLSEEHGKALEHGYENLGTMLTPIPVDNPYYQLGTRLRRFHPTMNGLAE